MYNFHNNGVTTKNEGSGTKVLHVKLKDNKM